MSVADGLLIAGLIVLLLGGFLWRMWPVVLDSPAVEFPQGPTPVVLSAEVVALREVLMELQRPRRRPGVPVTIRLMSGSLQRELGSVVVEDRLREPSIQCWIASDDTVSNFIASHQEGDQWIYRRVGVERLGRA